MASLCLLDDSGGLAQFWEIGAQPLAVGRDETAEIQIEDEALSRRHFVICREGTEYVLKDLDSQNGTFVRGRRAKAAKLEHHDCIVAGKTLFLFNKLSASTTAAVQSLAQADTAVVAAALKAQQMTSAPRV